MKKRHIFAFLVVAFALVGCSGAQETALTGNEFRVPLADVSGGQAKYFETVAGGTNVRFFVMQSTDGVYRAAFDACDVCYEAKKGYSQDGEFMVCNNCGMRFHSGRINEVKGGCNPAPLTRSIDGNELVVSLADIAAGASYF